MFIQLYMFYNESIASSFFRQFIFSLLSVVVGLILVNSAPSDPPDIPMDTPGRKLSPWPTQDPVESFHRWPMLPACRQA